MSDSVQEGTVNPSRQNSDTRKTLIRKLSIQTLQPNNPASLCSTANLTLKQFLEFGPDKLNIRLLPQEELDAPLEECIFEIEISDIPCFHIVRTFREVTAFYQAFYPLKLALKFPHLKWPKYITDDEAMENQENWRNFVNKILSKLQERARININDREMALGIIYVFLIDNEKALETPKRKSLTRHLKEGRMNRSWSEDDIDINTDTTVEILQVILNELENKMNELYSNDKSPHRRKNALISKTALLSEEILKKEYVLFDKENDNKQANIPSEPISASENSSNSENKSPDALRTNLSSDEHTVDRITETNQYNKKADKTHIGGTLKKLWNKAFHRTSSLNVVAEQSPESEQAISETKEHKAAPLMDSLSDISLWKSFGQDVSQDFTIEESQAQKENKTSSRSLPTENSKPSHSREIMKLMKKEIKSFAGYIYMKLSFETEWLRYYAKIDKNCIIFNKNLGDSVPVHIVPCYRATVKYIENNGKEYLEVFHVNDSEKIQLIIDPSCQKQSDFADPFKNLRMWHTQLKIAANKPDDLKLLHNNYYPIGKLQLVVSEASSIKGLPQNSSCYTRILHIPYTLQTTLIQSSDNMKWKQSFFIPLCDPFLPIKMELVCVYHEGWLKETRKEEVICTGEILVTDIIPIKSDSVFSVVLNFKYTENKKKTTKAVSLNENEIVQPKVKVKIRNLSNIKSLFAPSYGNYVEGVQMDTETYVKQNFKLSIRRVRRIIRYIKLFLLDTQAIFHYKYPFFSLCCLLLFSYIGIVTETDNLLANFILFIVLLCAYKHPTIEAKIRPIIERVFFQEQDQNIYYTEPLITTSEEVQTNKDLNTEKWKYKIPDEDNLVTLILLIKRILAWLTITMTKIAGFCEKLKNIIIWKEPLRTSIFITAGLAIYCIIVIVPIRWIFLLAVWANFAKGINFYKNRRKRNEEVARSTINFIMKRFFPTYYQQILRNPSMVWPTTFSSSNFQRKMVEQLKYRLQVSLPEDVLCIYRTPKELINALSTCSKPLKFKTDSEEKAHLGLIKWKTPTFTLKNLVNFIMNAPSDYYRIIHPKAIDLELSPDTLLEEIHNK